MSVTPPSPAAPAATRGGRTRLLNWPWWYAALGLVTVSTVFAWLQVPPPVPVNRGDRPWSLLDVRETNPHRRLLSVLDDLNGVYFAQRGLRGWAVGHNGRILATTDGGANWHQQESTTTLNLVRIIFQPDGRQGWAGTEDRSLVSTTDGGEHWQASNEPWASLGTRVKLDTAFGKFAPIASADYAAAPFEAQLPSWPMTTDGTVVGPAAGHTSYGHGRLVAGHVDSGNRSAWGVGKAGTIIATDDGGKTWHPQTSTTQPSLAGLWIAPDGMRAWVVGSQDTILNSANGGHSWAPLASGTRAGLSAVTFLADGLHGWAGGDNGTIIATGDGGKTWTKPQYRDVPLFITGLQFSADGKAGFATTDDGVTLVTSNGGEDWTVGEGALSSDLSSVGFSPEGKIGWALRETFSPLIDGGRLEKSADSGKTWSPANYPNPLLSVSFAADGLHGVAIAGEGTNPVVGLAGTNPPGRKWTMLTTDDGGANWQVQQDLRHLRPYEVKLANDGQRGLALALGGQILSTEDGGRHWHQAETYSRSPPPWYWLAAALSAGLAWMAWRLRPARVDKESVADMATSDAEVRDPGDDRLQFRGLARGISRFLRNTETQPPLTLAITGDWGSGKSSLMHLVCADLRRYGNRPIWFNAWHHQKEEHLFAALLGAIHAQAAPPLFSMSGLSFRLRLLWLRSWRNFGVMMLVVAVVTGLLLFSVKAFNGGGFDNLTASINTLRELAERPLAAVTALSAALTALLAIVKGATAFRVNPALLLGKAREHMSLKTAAAQNDFRDRFARQFDDLTQALPYRLVVVVDDLDRCRAGSVIDVMEAVNYLTSAGKCFVIFGMASERVTAALGLAFKDIAAELVQMEANADPRAAASSLDPPELARRRAYATDYLQKLVNIEIKVPTGESKAVHRLLLAAEPPQRRRVTGFFNEAARLWPLVAASVAITVGVWLAGQAGQLLEQAKGAIPGVAPAAKVSPAPAGTAVPTPARAGKAPSQVDASAGQGESHPFQVDPGEAIGLQAKLAWAALAMVPLLAIAGLITLLLLRRTLYQTRDSAQFKDALEIWTPVVACKRNTPRAIKRFGNRLRYLAMLQQGEEQDKTLLDLLQEHLQQWHRRNDEASDVAADQQSALSEHQLIALGALYEVLDVHWKERMKAIFSSGPDNQSSLIAGYGKAFVHQVQQAARGHQNRFDTMWPPSDSEIEVFERLVAGVRLAGDPRIITASPSPSPSQPPPPSQPPSPSPPPTSVRETEDAFSGFSSPPKRRPSS